MSPVWLTGLSAWQAQQVAVSCLEQIITHRPGLSYALPQSGVSPDLPGKRLNPSQTLETSASTTSDAAGQPRHDHVTDLAGPAAHARAAETYARLAPLIGQTRYIRLSPDGGTSFPGQARHTRLLRPLLPQLPAQPCTVSVYDSDRGVGRLLVADLDVQRAIARGMTRHEAIAAVHDEAQALIELIERCGGRAISDRSPNGGRHVYVRFARALPWTDLRQLAYALALRFHTLDIWPMSSRHGQIRPPGALHKLEHGHLTGYMTLTLPYATPNRSCADPADRPSGPHSTKTSPRNSPRSPSARHPSPPASPAMTPSKPAPMTAAPAPNATHWWRFPSTARDGPGCRAWAAAGPLPPSRNNWPAPATGAPAVRCPPPRPAWAC